MREREEKKNIMRVEHQPQLISIQFLFVSCMQFNSIQLMLGLLSLSTCIQLSEHCILGAWCDSYRMKSEWVREMGRRINTNIINKNCAAFSSYLLSLSFLCFERRTRAFTYAHSFVYGVSRKKKLLIFFLSLFSFRLSSSSF